VPYLGHIQKKLAAQKLKVDYWLEGQDPDDAESLKMSVYVLATDFITEDLMFV
jgi:hypothetical protein